MLEEISAVNFRPFERLHAGFFPGPNFLVGPNARGKTSILEAVCFLLRLQSPRTSAPAECVRFGSGGFSLDGRFAGRHLRVRFDGRLKRFSLDAKESVPAADYLSVARVTWIANSDLDLVCGSPSARRRFLDFLGVQLGTGYLPALRAYERALRARNALLRDARPPREIRAFDAPLADAGDRLLATRAHCVRELEPFAAAAFLTISGGMETLACRYEPGCAIPMAQALDAAWESDLRARTTTSGPHRDDLVLSLDGRPPATFASEGQQRSCALALKFGQAGLLFRETGCRPVCLVDDIFGELDPGRRTRLLGLLPNDSVALVTTTSTAWLEGLPPAGREIGISGIRLFAGAA